MKFLCVFFVWGRDLQSCVLSTGGNVPSHLRPMTPEAIRFIKMRSIVDRLGSETCCHGVWPGFRLGGQDHQFMTSVLYAAGNQYGRHFLSPKSRVFSVLQLAQTVIRLLQL